MSKTTELYERVTSLVLAKLETAGSWQKLWDVPPPISLNGHVYRGVNFLLLSTDQFKSPVYGTFDQIRKNGGAVRKGEKATIIIFWDRLTEKDESGSITESKFFLKYYNVFNVEQAEFDEIGKTKIAELSCQSHSTKHSRIFDADQIYQMMPDPPQIKHHKADRASYSQVYDTITIPHIEYFKTSEEYYATLFHELVHSTGHYKRLNRFDNDKTVEPSKIERYSKEELVAELGASMLCAVAGMNFNAENSAAYISGWSKPLKENSNWIVWAARRAELACDFILANVEQEAIV